MAKRRYLRDRFMLRGSLWMPELYPSGVLNGTVRVLTEESPLKDTWINLGLHSEKITH